MLSVTHGNPSLEEISVSDEQFWPIYPSLAEIPPVTDLEIPRVTCVGIRHSWNVQLLYGRSTMVPAPEVILNLSALGR